MKGVPLEVVTLRELARAENASSETEVFNFLRFYVEF